MPRATCQLTQAIFGPGYGSPGTILQAPDIGVAGNDWTIVVRWAHDGSAFSASKDTGTHVITLNLSSDPADTFTAASLELLLTSSICDVSHPDEISGRSWSIDSIMAARGVSGYHFETLSYSASFSGGVDDPTTGAGASAGTGSTGATGAATATATGTAAGTSTASAKSGLFGSAAGTSTATGVGAALIAARGASDGHATAFASNPLRQAVGFAAGTSGNAPTAPAVLAATQRSDMDHIAGAFDRLCEQFREKQI